MGPDLTHRLPRRSAPTATGPAGERPAARPPAPTTSAAKRAGGPRHKSMKGENPRRPPPEVLTATEGSKPVAVLTKSTPSAVFTDADARAAVAQLTDAEGLPSPQVVSFTDGVILVSVADRDEVDEWSAMLNAPAVRWGDLYGAGWEPKVKFPGLRVRVTVYCAVQPTKWQPRQNGRVAA